jgi:hypothetical protein
MKKKLTMDAIGLCSLSDKTIDELIQKYLTDSISEFKKSKFRYHTQNPLFFDYEKLYINGGIQPYIDKVRELGR